MRACAHARVSALVGAHVHVRVRAREGAFVRARYLRANCLQKAILTLFNESFFAFAFSAFSRLRFRFLGAAVAFGRSSSSFGRSFSLFFLTLPDSPRIALSRESCTRCFRQKGFIA